MGRRSAFAREDAVRSARDVFWSEGYESASMASLQRATGLNASKHLPRLRLQARSVRRRDRGLPRVRRPPRARPPRAPEVAPDALERYFLAARALFAYPSGRTLPDGCLLVNTACSGLARDDGIAEAVRAYRAESLAAFTRGAQARRPDQSPQERARLVETCVAPLISALVMTRVDRDAATAALDSALTAIQHQEQAHP
ncbi:TetR/AcrR family transcriptional regulator [Brachybacterium sp. GPGPB12]|uniref:TetR/AcrR family transcriptional regulator n=1 Tax=Brachybacterium sp. GPGPB12 TaxID=3023517 RepID=UPI0031345EE2